MQSVLEHASACNAPILVGNVLTLLGVCLAWEATTRQVPVISSVLLALMETYNWPPALLALPVTTTASDAVPRLAPAVISTTCFSMAAALQTVPITTINRMPTALPALPHASLAYRLRNASRATCPTSFRRQPV